MRRISRRRFLGLGLPVVGSLVAMGGLPLTARPTPAGERRYLIVNADDLGLGAAINRGVFETHARGILTSASLIVTGRAAEEAAREARQHPRLSLGLHVDLDQVNLDDLDVVAFEVDNQIDVFRQLTGRLPTHLDSHHHRHGHYNVAGVFLDASQRYRVPLRGFSDIVYYGGFWGWSAEGQTDPSRISVEALLTLALGIGPGLSAIGCHPGYYDSSLDDPYGRPRELEMRALTDPRVSRALNDAGITLVSYLDYPRLSATLAEARTRRRREAATRRRRASESIRLTPASE